MSKPQIRRWLKALATEALVVTAIYFLISHLVSNWNQIAPKLQHIRYGYLALATLATLSMQLLMPWGWIFAMRWVGIPLSGQVGFKIYYRSSIFRYLPGSLWYLPGRAYLCQQRGIPLTLFSASAVLELFFLLTLGGAISAVALASRFRFAWMPIASAAYLFCIIIVLIRPGIVRWFVLRKSSLNDSRSNIFALMVVCLFIWLTYGISVILLFSSFDVSIMSSAQDVMYTISATVAAWMSGFLSFVPTGMGIREVSLSFFFQQTIQSYHIILISLTQRTIELLLEGGLWLVATWMKQDSSPIITNTTKEVLP